MSKKRPKAKKNAWFIPVRGSYLPAKRQGWLLYIPLVILGGFMVFSTVMIVRSEGNVFLAIAELAVGLYLLGVVFTLIAKRKS
jgi:hypothetical protein